MPFLSQALIWNFWPRMIDTPGANRHTMRFRLMDDDRKVPIPDPRYHPRLRGFVEAMDRMRLPPDEDDDFNLDRSVDSRRPARRLGRLVIAKGPVASIGPLREPLTQGARALTAGVHHVALMRAPEIVVRYLAGEPPPNGRLGYSGVFCSDLTLDDAFKASEPPAHDDWVPRSVADKTHRSYINIALNRIRDVCREAAGYHAGLSAADRPMSVPLGQFADALAVLMPGVDGPGARRAPHERPRPRAGRPQRPDRNGEPEDHDQGWIDEDSSGNPADASGNSTEPEQRAHSLNHRLSDSGATERTAVADPPAHGRPARPPQIRSVATPVPRVTDDGAAVLSYPFEVRGHGNRVPAQRGRGGHDH